MLNTGKSDIAIAQLLNSAEDRSSSLEGSRADPEGTAPVPKVARLLRAGQGTFMYVGDSANVSFLQTVRKMALFAIGPCDLTTDPLRHSFLEMRPDPAAAKMGNGLDPNLHFGDVEGLVRQYALATSGLLDIIDVDDFLEGLPAWVANPSRDKDAESSIAYLVLAIGAQASASENTQALGEWYFTQGRRLAFSAAFSEVPCLLTVQTYVLITSYLLGACRRNSAFMNLGTALRAAYALGIHRSNANALFCDKERRDRNRAWKSLRVMDIFLSASLGRPPATSDFEYEPPGDESPAAELCRAAPEDKFRIAVVILCRIFECILTDVYKKQVVSPHVAEKISLQFRAWAVNLPPSLDLSSFSEEPSDTSDLKEFLAASHIIGGYYWSIIILTRPFLAFQVSQHVRRKRGDYHSSSGAEEDSCVSVFADACVDSALRSLDLVYSLRHFTCLPRRLPFIVNYIFNSALVLGAAFFADYDTSLPLEEGLTKAEAFLEIFLPHDPHACRYAQIMKYLHSAVTEYVNRRNRRSMEKRSERVNRLFGSVGRRPERETPTSHNSEVAAASYLPSSSNMNMAYHSSNNNNVHNQRPHTTANGLSNLPSPVSAEEPPAPANYHQTASDTRDEHNHGLTYHPAATEDFRRHHHNLHQQHHESSGPGVISTLTTTGIPIGYPGLSIDDIPSRLDDDHRLFRERLVMDGGYPSRSAEMGGLLDAADHMGNACTPPLLDTVLADDGLFYITSYPPPGADLGMVMHDKE